MTYKKCVTRRQERNYRKSKMSHLKISQGTNYKFIPRNDI
jgi:hypothetical protein